MNTHRMPRLLTLVAGATASLLAYGAHGQEIGLTKSNFVKLFKSMTAAECPTWHGLPGERPIRGWWCSDELPHWHEMINVFAAAEIAIDRAVTQQQLGDALGGSGSEAVLASNRSDIMRFVDDFCGTPPKWPLPWPPPNFALNPEGLPAVDLFAAGARFQEAADVLEGHPLQADFSAAADRLFETGLSRLAQE